jgi:hypothetical protein
MKLLGQPLKVVNVGLDSFADAMAGAGAAVQRVRWAPPAGGDLAAARAVAALLADPRVEAANQQAFARYLEAEPVIEGVGIAGEVIPRMGERMLLHAGPPVPWARMGGPMKGAIVGAILLEGWAKDHAAAAALAASGEIAFDPCHHHDAVGPMAGVIAPSMPVWIVKNAKHGNRAFSGLNEGLGKVLRMGANSEEVIARLKWMRATLAPVLQKSLAITGPIEMKPLMARALHMGDEVHNRNVAASSLLFKRLAPAMLRARLDPDEASAALDFINGNDHFFINVGMAACKSMLDVARDVPYSSMVTVMARNGVEVGIRVSGTGDQWFTAEAQVPDGLFFSGYSRADGSPDIGDSAITETAGVGGFAMAAAPAIVQFVGGTPASALATTVEMANITIGRNSAFTLPALDFVGSPAGIDVRKVVDTGIQPVINTGIAHREPGIGQIGAGVVRAPMGCFAKAIVALAKTLG